MSEKYITASECITAFKTIGLNVTKGAFSKQKEKGIYKIYHKGNSKRDLFIFDEALSSYLGSTIPKDHIEDKLRSEIKKKHEIHKLINEQWTIIESYEELTFEMFDIKDLWINAAANLKEFKENEIKSEAKSDREIEYIILEASKTKEDHAEEFKREIFAVNKINLDNRDFAWHLCEDLEKVYKDFAGSTFNYYILKSFADWMSLSNPKEWADSHGVDLVKK